jgi:hypothetical protein
MTAYPVEFQRRCESRAGLGIYESARRMPWLLAIGQMLRVELDDVEQPVSERLAALLKELDGPPFAAGHFAPDPSTAEAGAGI